MQRSNITRRTFVGSTLAAGALATLGTPSRILGANEEIRVAVAGVRSRGNLVGNQFRNIKGVHVVTLCDPDQDILDQRVKEWNKSDKHKPVTGERDIRKVIDDPNIDALVVCTPNHWHALATIWACQAGKDVYVEKPVSWGIWEGQQMVAAAQKHNRIVQSGTQDRSDVGFNKAIEFINNGEIGKPQYAHGLWFNLRKPIGKVSGPQQPPKSVDYDLWCGPASNGPLMRENLHYDWHWQWEHGNGEMANVGIHQLDGCRYALGLTGLPKRTINILGGRFLWDDDGETPNMQLAYYDYDIPIIIQIRDLPATSGRNAKLPFRKIDRGNIIQCEGGYFAGGRNGGWVYDNKGKRMKQFPGDGGRTHAKNFIDALRSRKVSDLIAPIEQGHWSTALSQTANISHLIGTQQTPDEIRANRTNLDDRVVEVLEHMHKQLDANEIDYGKTPCYTGPQLVLDEKTHRFTGEHADKANAYLKREKDREPFVVPTLV